MHSQPMASALRAFAVVPCRAAFRPTMHNLCAQLRWRSAAFSRLMRLPHGACSAPTAALARMRGVTPM